MQTVEKDEMTRKIADHHRDILAFMVYFFSWDADLLRRVVHKPRIKSFSSVSFTVQASYSLLKSGNRIDFLSMIFSPNPKSKIANPKSFNHPVRPRQHIRRNRLTILDFGYFDLAQ